MKKDRIYQYKSDSIKRSKSYQGNKSLQEAWQNFHAQLVKSKYAYNFFWLGVPILQLPQDLHAMQEIIWQVKPDLIIETGIAWGGSVMFSASMLAILETCGEIKKGQVVGIEQNIWPENRKNIMSSPLSNKITMIEGSSVDPLIVKKIKQIAKNKRRVLVCLDSNHTHDHVLAELKAYAPIVTKGSYFIVGDTGVEDLPEGSTKDRPWGKGNNPKTAVWAFLKENKKFKIDKEVESKLIMSGSPDGYLKKIK